MSLLQNDFDVFIILSRDIPAMMISRTKAPGWDGNKWLKIDDSNSNQIQ